VQTVLLELLRRFRGRHLCGIFDSVAEGASLVVGGCGFDVKKFLPQKVHRGPRLQVAQA
jgi:hypothetical protein